MKRKVKRKPVYPGIGAAQSARHFKRNRERRIAAAANYVFHSQLAIRGDYLGGFPKDHWCGLFVVQAARKSYLAALAAESYRPIERAA